MKCKKCIIKVTVLLLSVSAIVSCKTTSHVVNGGDDRTTEVEMLNSNTYFLTEYASDPNYGVTKELPIKVGGIKENEGPVNERRYLNALLSESGNSLKFYRTGSCCAFTTPNGLIGNTGLLDVYKVYEEGSSDTTLLYFNMYDKGDLFIPTGFKVKEQ